MPYLARECRRYQPDDDLVGEGADGEGFQFLVWIERQFENGCGAAGDLAAFAFEGGGIEHAGLAGLKVDARGQRAVEAKLIVVREVVLLDGPPSFRVAEREPAHRVVGVGDDHFAVIDSTL